MKIQIHDFWSLQKLAEHPFSEKTAIISIGDVGSEMPALAYQPLAILRLEFDDIRLSDKNNGKPLSREQAKQIAHFVKQYQDKAKTLICQCEFGVSRSPAVAAAIMQYLDGSGLEIFTENRYKPNIHVFQTVTEEFYKKGKRGI